MTVLVEKTYVKPVTDDEFNEVIRGKEPVCIRMEGDRLMIYLPDGQMFRVEASVTGYLAIDEFAYEGSPNVKFHRLSYYNVKIVIYEYDDGHFETYVGDYGLVDSEATSLACAEAVGRKNAHMTMVVIREEHIAFGSDGETTKVSGIALPVGDFTWDVAFTGLPWGVDRLGNFDEWQLALIAIDDRFIELADE